MSKIQKRLEDFPKEETIESLRQMSKDECPMYPLTLNQCTKIYWKWIKGDSKSSLRTVFRSRLRRHIKEVTRTLKREPYSPVKIGKVHIGKDYIVYNTDEMPKLTIRSENLNVKRSLETLCQEQCIIIIGNEVYTKREI